MKCTPHLVPARPRRRRRCAICATAVASAALVTLSASGGAGQAPAASHTASVAGLEAKFVDVGGVQTRYYEYGEGEPMVLVHGGGRGTTSSANNWSTVIPLLARRYHVFAVDKSAAGMTGNPLDDRDLSPEGEVKHMYEFIQTMKLGPAHLVGHSSGGALAFYLATEHPEIAKTLIVVAQGPGMPSAGEGPTKHDLAEESTCTAPQTTYEGRKCRLELLAHTPATFDEAFLRADSWMADRPKSKEARAKYAAMPREARAERTNTYRQRAWDRARQEGVLQMPILIYAGKQDTLSWVATEPYAMMRGELDFFNIVGAKNERVQLIVVNEAGHFPYREHPEAFTDDLTRFIEFWTRSR